MLPTATLRVLLVVPLLLVAAAFLGISGAIVVRNRPLLVRGSLLALALLLISAPIAVAVVVIAISIAEPQMTCFAVFQIGVLALMVWGAHRALRGYLVIGISEETFREALRSALARLALPFEETLVGFALTSLNETLRTSLAPRLGSAHFQMKSVGHGETLTQIARRVEEFLRVDGSPPETIAALVYGVAGIVVLVLAAFQALRF
jgi:hypothetical protein